MVSAWQLSVSNGLSITVDKVAEEAKDPIVCSAGLPLNLRLDSGRVRTFSISKSGIRGDAVDPILRSASLYQTRDEKLPVKINTPAYAQPRVEIQRHDVTQTHRSCSLPLTSTSTYAHTLPVPMTI